MEIIQANALDWCRDNPSSQKGIITGIPDMSELDLNETEYLEFFRRSAKAVLNCLTDRGYAIFIHTDRKQKGWIDKSYYITDEAYKGGFRMMWHKIALIRDVGVSNLYQPTYSHMLCFSKKGTPQRSTEDVIHRGKTLYKNGMGYDAVEHCLIFLQKHNIDTIADPFVGQGTTLLLAQKMGFTRGVGIDICPKQCEIARNNFLNPRYTMLIPRLIHQIWWELEGPIEDVPEYYEPHKKMLGFCEEHMIPHRIWNKEECETLAKPYQELWESFRYDIQRIDFARILILKEYGGLYVDMDVYPVKNIDDLFLREEVFVRWKGGTNSYNAIMGTCIQHPIWNEVLEESKERTAVCQAMEYYDTWTGKLVSQTTGCALLTRVLKQNKRKNTDFLEIVRVYSEKKNILSEPDDYRFQDSSVSGWYHKRHRKGYTAKKHEIQT
jgi:hypothetical protein